MFQSSTLLAAKFSTLILVLSTTSIARANQPIEFDLPNVIPGEVAPSAFGGNQVSFPLRLSSLIIDPEAASVDRWIIRCAPRKRTPVVDYSPKTELHSDYEGPIQVTQTNENTHSFGVGVNADYQKMVRGNIGLDDQSRKSNSRKFNQVAPLQTVVASGTFDRGHGVFFKLRSTPTSVLEGEKTFQVSFAISDDWRGGVFDVTVVAQKTARGFAGDDHIHTLASRHFVVAVYPAGITQSRELAIQLAQAERELRRVAVHTEVMSSTKKNPVESLFGSLTAWAKNDPKPNPSSHWLPRVLSRSADPYTDKSISRLPMSTRVAVLDYCQARDDFENQTVSNETLVSVDQG